MSEQIMTCLREGPPPERLPCGAERIGSYVPRLCG